MIRMPEGRVVHGLLEERTKAHGVAVLIDPPLVLDFHRYTLDAHGQDEVHLAIGAACGQVGDV